MCFVLFCFGGEKIFQIIALLKNKQTKTYLPYLFLVLSEKEHLFFSLQSFDSGQ